MEFIYIIHIDVKFIVLRVKKFHRLLHYLNFPCLNIYEECFMEFKLYAPKAAQKFFNSK